MCKPGPFLLTKEWISCFWKKNKNKVTRDFSELRFIWQVTCLERPLPESTVTLVETSLSYAYTLVKVEYGNPRLLICISQRRVTRRTIKTFCTCQCLTGASPTGTVLGSNQAIQPVRVTIGVLPRTKTRVYPSRTRYFVPGIWGGCVVSFL